MPADSPTVSLPAEVSPVAAEFVAAMSAGDHDLADAILPRLDGPLSRDVLRMVTDLHFRRSRWAEAAAAADRHAGDDTATALRRNLARNLASVRAHRPEVYQAVMAALGGDRYTPVSGADGHPTIARRKADGSLESLSQSNQPRAALAATVNSLQPATEKGAALALCSVGDGYLVQYLAKNPPKLFMDQQQPVYVIEPDAAQLAAVFLIHDCSGPTGPIEQPRFEWYVGKDWNRRLREAFFDDLTHLFPVLNVTSGPAGVTADAELKKLLQDLNLLDARMAEQVRAYYARLTKDDFAAVMSENPPRKPRVLLLTTRFSTVLQYSTNDTADAFRQLGWDARVVIEAAPYRGSTSVAFRRQLAEFKPDLVFQIDHLRHEHGALVPPQVPFVCWVQDHLPNLADRRAGGAVGPRDFVLTNVRGMYRDRFGYPDRQLVDVSKLTRVPVRPATWASGEPDLAYVSNAAQLPAAIAAGIVGMFAKDSPAARLAAAACDRLGRVYADGGACYGIGDVAPLAEQAAAETGVPLTVFERPDRFLDVLFDRLNNALYRQQSLTWVADVADRMGLTLGLYGNGWAEHPRFAKYARGVVAYGPDLERLTREAKINLQIVPFFCLHQRLLDGLAAGGFFLVRAHPTDVSLQALSNFLLDHVDASAATLDEARACVDPARLAELDRLAAMHDVIRNVGDPVELVRGFQRIGVLAGQDETLPRLGEVTFGSAAAFEAAVRRFIADDRLRAAVAREQRENVESRLSYTAGMRRVVARVGGLIESEPTVNFA